MLYSCQNNGQIAYIHFKVKRVLLGPRELVLGSNLLTWHVVNKKQRLSPPDRWDYPHPVNNHHFSRIDLQFKLMKRKTFFLDIFKQVSAAKNFEEIRAIFRKYSWFANKDFFSSIYRIFFKINLQGTNVNFGPGSVIKPSTTKEDIWAVFLSN